MKRIFIMEIVIKIQSADAIRQDQTSYMAAEANLYGKCSTCHILILSVRLLIKWKTKKEIECDGCRYFILYNFPSFWEKIGREKERVRKGRLEREVGKRENATIKGESMPQCSRAHLLGTWQLNFFFFLVVPFIFSFINKSCFY